MSSGTRAGSRSLKSTSTSCEVSNGCGEPVAAKRSSNQLHSTNVMCRTSPRRLSPEGGTPSRTMSSGSIPSHFHSNVARW